MRGARPRTASTRTPLNKQPDKFQFVGLLRSGMSYILYLKSYISNLISQILYLFLSSRVSYLANRVLRVVDQLSPGARMAAAGFSSQLMEPSSWLGRLCQGSMHTNWGFPGLLQMSV